MKLIAKKDGGILREGNGKIVTRIGAFISMLSLVANYSVASESAAEINTNVFFSAAEKAVNPLNVFLMKLQNTYSFNAFIAMVVLIALVVFYDSNHPNAIRYKSSIIPAMFFAICYIVGKSYSMYGTDELIFSNGFQIFFSVLSFIGLTLLFWHVISFVQVKIDEKQFESDKNSAVEPCTINWGKCVFLILLAWAPFIVAYFPGCIPWDTMLQIRQFVGIDPLLNHFPILVTLIMGSCYSLGLMLGNIGIFLYLLCQVLVGALSFGLIIKKLIEWKMPHLMINLTVLFYALCPIWSSAEASTMKDYIYFPFFALYAICYMDLFLNRTKRTENKKIITFTILAILLILTRSEGIYIVLFSTAILGVTMIFENKKNAGIIFVVCACLFISNSLYIKTLNNAGRIIEFDKREAYSAVFQCTARYINEYEQELTADEKNVIDTVLNYEEIKQSYTPGYADGVKDTYRSPDKTCWNNYINLWLKCFIKHPKVYLDSVLSGVFGYFLPGYNYPTKEVYFLYIRQFEGDPTIQFYFSDEVRAVFESYINLWKNGSITSILFSSGIYTWAMIWAFWNLFRKKQFLAAVGILPVFLVLGICCISPVTGLLRYAMPYIACTPLTIAYSIKLGKSA